MRAGMRRFLFLLTQEKGRKVFLNPFQPNTSLHILRSVLFTFPKVMTRGIFPKVKSFFS